MDILKTLSSLKLIDFFLIALIGLSIFFRVHELPSAEVLFPDGHVYWSMAKLANEGNFHYYQAKPGHIFSLWLAGSTLGWENQTPLLVSVITGLLSIILVYMISIRYFNLRAALIASALFAMSPWHIFYSRSSGASANAQFFILCAIYCYLYSRQDCHKSNSNYFFDPSQNHITNLMLALSGIFVGTAFTFHHNTGLFPFVFLFYEILLWLNLKYFLRNELLGFFFIKEKNHSFNTNGLDESFNKKPNLFYFGLERLFILFSSMLLPLVFFNVLHIFLIYLPNSELSYDPTRMEQIVIILSYFQQIFVEHNTNMAWTFGGGYWTTPLFFKIIGNNLGKIFSILFVFSLVCSFKLMNKRVRLLFLIFVAPMFLYFFFLVNSEYLAGAHNIVYFVPFMVLIIGYVLSKIKDNLLSRFLVLTLLISSGVENLPLLVSLTQVKSINNQVVTYLKDNGIKPLNVVGDPAKSVLNGAIKNMNYFQNISMLLESQKIKETNQNRVIENYFLVHFINSNFLKNLYHCDFEMQWFHQTGRSSLNFDLGRVSRVWDFKPKAAGFKLDSFVLLKGCKF